MGKDRAPLNVRVPRTPYADGITVIVVSGESFTITGDQRDGTLVNLRLAEGAPGADTIEVRFEQIDMGSGPAMVLTVKNHFALPLKYRALMKVPGRPGLYRTSSCPVMAGLQGTELWPQPIAAIFMRELRFVPAGTRVSCTE
jgi:hypothetical protein